MHGTGSTFVSIERPPLLASLSNICRWRGRRTVLHGYKLYS